jgi:DNA-binding transcriptional MocR family regulator
MSTDMTRPDPIYRQLACEFSSVIQRGQLKPGERLPSVRRLAIQRHVSISTALQTLRTLENSGLIEARPQSGYFVRCPSRRLEEPETSRPPRKPAYVGISGMVAGVREAANNPNIVAFGTASPAPDLFPASRLQRSLTSVTRRKPMLLTTYGFSSGNAAFRHEIAKRYLNLGVNIDEREFVVTHGCTEAIGLALRAVTKPGDTIALESPTFYGTLQTIESLGLKVIEIPTHPREGISLDALEVVICHHDVKAVVVMANIANPLGSIMPDERKKRLVEMAEGSGIPLIEDDIYGDLPFDGPRPLPLKAFERDGGVMLCSSFTKTLAAGLRVGWIAPGKEIAKIEILKFINTLTTPEVPQLALAAYLAEGGYDHHLRRIRRAFANQVRQMQDAVTAYFPEGTRVTRPLGGFVIWAELPGDVDTMKLFDEAITAGVSFAPGRIFSASDRYSTCMRLSCGYPWSPLREQAIVKLGQLVKNDVKLRTVQMRKRSGSTSLAPPAISFDRFAPR